MNTGVRAGPDRETNVTFPAAPHETGAPGRIGSYLHWPLNEAGIVAAAVPTSDLGRKLTDCVVEDGDVIDDRVRTSVPWA